jgi:aryl-alcohol dehydrogenase-like predicted oxidoreductase
MENEVTRRQFVHAAAAATGAAVGLTATQTISAGNPAHQDTGKILNYNPDMEYRRCGKTGLMLSAVCLGGHWKRLNTLIPDLFRGGGWLSAKLELPEFEKNRSDVLTRCIERGVYYVDACAGEEILAYAKALKGRRDQMYLGYSWHVKEVRYKEWCTRQKLQQGLDEGMKEAGLECVDLWRISLLTQSSRHSDAEIEEVAAALDWAKQTGRARFVGISSHDRSHIKKLIEKYPDQMEVILTPYTAKTKLVSDETGLWSAIRKSDVGWFGIKPFAGGSLFRREGSPDGSNQEEGHRIARLAIRHILCNPAITAPIPGLITTEQVDNVALAVKERRELDLEEKAELQQAMDRAWANLSYQYRWLKDWEYV